MAGPLWGVPDTSLCDGKVCHWLLAGPLWGVPDTALCDGKICH